MDKNGKIGGKISIIDIGVIVLIFAAAIGLVIRFTSGTTTAVTSNETFRYVVKVNMVREYTVNALQKRGITTDKKAEMVLGEIKDVKVEDSKIQSTTASGKIEWSNLPDKYTCYVTIEAEGRESEDGYILDDTTELSVGRSVDIITKNVKTSGEIISVDVVE